MAPQHSSAPNSQTKKKRKRRVLTLHEKMTILKKIEQGRTCSSVAREYDCNESSIRSIKKCESKIKTSIKLLSSVNIQSTFLSRRDTNIEQMEHLLSIWIDEEMNKNVLLTSTMIRQQALIIYDRLKSQNPQSSELSFCASKGWFDRFRKRANLRNINVVSEGVEEGVENFKRSTCWTKIPHDDESESQGKKSIHTEIEKIINLSNMIEREGLGEAEQGEIVDHVGSDHEELVDGNVEDMVDVKTLEMQEENKEDKEQIETTTNKKILDILKAAEFLKEKIMQGDFDSERSSKIRQDIDNIMKPYAYMKEKYEQQAEITDSVRMSTPASDGYSS